MKKILMISYYFPPTIGGGIFRVMRFIKYLPQNGWMPVIMTPKESYVPGEDREVGEKMLRGIPASIKIIRTKTFEILNMGRRSLKKAEDVQIQKSVLLFMKRYISKIIKSISIPDEVMGWIPFATINGNRAIRKEGIGTIYTTSPPASVHLIGLLLKWVTRRPWIADFRDPWTQGIGFKKHNFARKGLELLLERTVIKNADQVITTTPAISDYFRSKHPVHSHKIATITNGYDPDDFIKALNYKSTKKFTITHTGYLFGHRNSIPFLQSMLSLIRQGLIPRKDIEINFIGYTDESAKKFARENNIEDIVKFISYLPHDEIVKRQKESSLLLLVTDPRGTIQIPGKLFEYICSGRPILALAPEGVCSDIIDKTKTGWVIGFEDVKGIAEIIAKLYRDFKQDKLKISPNYSYIEKYDVKNLTNKFCQYLTSQEKQTVI